jgi:hypothetical protein
MKKVHFWIKKNKPRPSSKPSVRICNKKRRIALEGRARFGPRFFIFLLEGRLPGLMPRAALVFGMFIRTSHFNTFKSFGFVFYHPFQICEALHYVPLIIKFHINNTILLLRNYCFAKFLDLYIYFTTDYKTKTQYCLIDAGLVGDA